MNKHVVPELKFNKVEAWENGTTTVPDEQLQSMVIGISMISGSCPHCNRGDWQANIFSTEGVHKVACPRCGKDVFIQLSKIVRTEWVASLTENIAK